MSRDDRYRVGIYADWHNPESIPNYKAKIVNGTTFIMLPQYPSPNHRFIIKDFIQVENREDIVNENEFWVDCKEGFVYFHPSLQDTWITIKEFYGIGINRIDAKRIVTKLDATGNVIQVLQDIIDAYKEIFEALANAMQLVKDVQYSLEVLKETQYPTIIVAKDQWTSFVENGITKYKATIEHNLLSINLQVAAIDLSTNMNMGSPPFKPLDNKTIEVYSFEETDIKYIISAGYYSGSINTDKTTEILTELYDARLGETTLKDKLLKILDYVYDLREYKAKKVYGIKADGVTDDTEALIKYASSSNDVIWLPKGTILIDNTITFKDKKIVGNDTTIKLKDQAYAFRKHKGMFVIKGTSELSGVTFDGNYDGNYITDSKGVVRHFVNVDGVGGDEPKGASAIFISDGLHASVHDCVFKDISWSSCDVASGKYIEIYRNVFLNGARDYVPVHGASHVRVYDNLAYYPTNHAYHAYSHLQHCTIENNVVVYTNTYKKEYIGYDARCAMYVDHGSYPESEVANTIVRNNKVIQEDKSYKIDCLRVVAYAKDVEICGNSFEDIIGFGIRIFSPTIGKCLIYDNTISTTEQCIQFKPELASGGNITYTSTGINGYMNIYNNTLSSSNNNIYQIYTVTDKLKKYYNILIEDNKYVNYKDYVITINKLNVKYKLTINDTMNYQIKKFDDLIKGKFYMHEDRLGDYRVISSLSDTTIRNGELLIYKNTTETTEVVTSMIAGKNGMKATLLIADGTIQFKTSGNVKIKDNLTSDIYRIYELYYYGSNWFIK